MKKRNIVFRLLAIQLAAVCLTGCGAQTVEEEPVIQVDTSEEGITYRMDTVSKGDVVKTKNINSSYVQTKAQEVAFSVGGKIVDKVYVKEGDKVEVGDLLVELQNGNLEDEIAELEYHIQKNELQYGYLDTYEKFDLDSAYYSFVTSTDMEEEDLEDYDKEQDKIREGYTQRREDLEDTLYYDKLKLEKKRSELASNRICATMAGTVINMKKNLEGSTAKRDDVIMMVVDNSNGLFETQDPEIGEYLEEGAVLPMTIVYGTGKGEYEVTPYQKSSWGEKQTFQTISEPDGATLEVGTSGTITATIDKRENVLRMPREALYEADGKSYTYTLDDDGMKQVRFIEIGLVGDSYVEILSGLSEAEKVIKK